MKQPLSVFFFRNEDGSVPTADWLRGLPAKPRDKCVLRLELLRDRGHELRRPHADYLTEGVYELRVKYGRVHYRMLYFFMGDMAVVVSHGLVKEDKVPRVDIMKAIERKTTCEKQRDYRLFLWEGA